VDQKIGVEQTKGNEKFYLHLYPFGLNLRKFFTDLDVAHVHPCVNYEWTKIQLRVNLE
jgi:hypothetical protein